MAIISRRRVGYGVAGLIGILLIISAPFIFLFFMIAPTVFDKKIDANPVLYARQERVASCSANFYLYENGKFQYIKVCFGRESTLGEYQIIGDSIFFFNPSDSFYKYAIYDREEKYLRFYDNTSDTTYGDLLPVIKDELIKNMKKVASTLLTEERFWEIIEKSDKGRRLGEELSKLSEDEIMGYHYWWLHFCNISYKQDLWAVAYTVLGGCSDDGFDYFRYWLLTRGKSIFYKAIENADSLCDEFDNLPDEEYPENEEVSYVSKEVFEEKFGKDFYDTEKLYDFGERGYPEIKFEWDEDDEESIHKVCPKTFDKWWGNYEF